MREQTGASKVDLVGYSLGATVARYWVNLLGGAAVTDRWVGLASPTYGGTIYGTSQIFEAIPGGIDLIEALSSLPVVQQLADSSLLARLNQPTDTVPGVQYTTIASRVDEVIQPVENIALRDPAATNIVVQDLCPIDLTGHFNMVYDPFALQLVLNALDPGACRRPAVRVRPARRRHPRRRAGVELLSYSASFATACAQRAELV